MKKAKIRNDKMILQLLLEYSCPQLQITYFPLILSHMSNNYFRNDFRKTIKMTNAIVSRGKKNYIMKIYLFLNYKRCKEQMRTNGGKTNNLIPSTTCKNVQ